MERDFSNAARFVLQTVDLLGIKLPSTSRLAEMGKLLMGADIPTGDPRLQNALEGVRDITILEFVFDQLQKRDADDPTFRQLCTKAIKDSILPQNDYDRSVGRDAQFELFVCAVCQSAGLTPVERDEPDVTCHVRGTKFGIAAKRVKNLDRLEERVKNASEQIERSKIPGVIAIDVSLAINPDNKRFTTELPEDQFGAWYGRSFFTFVQKYHDCLQELVRGKAVRGIVFHDYTVRFRPNKRWGLDGMSFWLSTSRKNRRRNKEADMFWLAYERGLKNRVELANSLI